MIGVNVNGYAVKQLKEAMDQEQLSWRSFADRGALGPGAIAAKGNLSATPTSYVIEHKGVIRYNCVGSPGEQTIDAALEKLIEEAEGNGKGD